MSIYTHFFFLCNRIHLIKSCLCCFVVMHLYSEILSAIATSSSIIKLELFLPCFSCNYNLNLSQISLRSDDKNIVFETPEAKTITLGDSGNFRIVQSIVDLLPRAFTTKYISFAKSYINFLSDKLAKSTLVFISYHFQKISYQFKYFTCITKC